jgi:hypothetical protein
MISEASTRTRSIISDALMACALTFAAVLIGTGVGALVYTHEIQDRSKTL